MRDATLDIAIILVVFLIAYIRPCAMARFFNTLVGRFILLAAIVLLSTANTLWGILGVLVLVSFRENMTEGMENMDDDKSDDGKEKESGDDKKSDEESDGEESDDEEDKKTKHIKPEEWRKKNCKADQVMLNGSVVDMDEFAKKFPNVSFLGGKCNPCMADCQIKVTAAAARLDAEDKVRSKSSNSLPGLGKASA
jgi:hypothetical protein